MKGLDDKSLTVQKLAAFILQSEPVVYKKWALMVRESFWPKTQLSSLTLFRTITARAKPEAAHDLHDFFRKRINVDVRRWQVLLG